MTNLIGTGIYTPAECARYTGVPRRSVKRWMQGYEYEGRQGPAKSAALWSKDLPEIEGQAALSFLDLIEVRFVAALRQKGVSWRAIRAASKKARQRFNYSHPFAMHHFLTDGRTVFIEAAKETGSDDLEDLAKSQLAFGAILRPILDDLEFVRQTASRWWPLGKKKSIVLDPARSFGAPITDREGVRTEILFNAYKANRSVDDVADWYAVDHKAVRDAIRFERGRAA